MYYTHINRGIIDANRKHGTRLHPIRVQKGKYGKSEYGSSVFFAGPSRIVYNSEGKILPCGARLVIVSEEKPVIDIGEGGL